jgi:hypothetical protein
VVERAATARRRYLDESMVVLEQTREGKRLVERRPREPVALAGVLFLALALLPLVSEGSVTTLRVVTALALGMGASLCFFLGLPLKRRLPLPERASVQKLRLSGTSNIEGYAVEALLPNGAHRIVLSGPDPGRVLGDALALSGELGVPLEPGWGISREDLSLFRSPVGAPLLVQPFVVNHRIVPDQAIGAGTALWAAAFIPSATVVLALSPARPSLTPTVLALVLPGLTALFALLVGLWLLGLRETLTLESGGITRRRRWFSSALGVATETPGVVALRPVSPLGGASRHLLAATRSGPVAFPTDPEAGETLSRYPGAQDRTAGRAAE